MRYDMIRWHGIARRDLKRWTPLLDCSDERERWDWHLYIMIPYDIPGVFQAWDSGYNWHGIAWLACIIETHSTSDRRTGGLHCIILH